jgi:hypothetical protein
MSISYVSDNTGNTIAVQISIEDWKQIKDKYPDVDDLDGDLPQWQKNLIDKRLKIIADHPERLRPIDELFEELDKED